MEGYSSTWTLTHSPAALEQVELETPSVGGSATSWAPHCDTRLDRPQRKSSPKSVLTPSCPPAQLGQPVLLVCCQGYNWHRRQQVTRNMGQGADSSEVGFWLIVQDMQPSHWQVLSAAAILRDRLSILPLVTCSVPRNGVGTPLELQLEELRLPAAQHLNIASMGAISLVIDTLSKIQYKFHPIEKKIFLLAEHHFIIIKSNVPHWNEGQGEMK